MHMHMDEWCIPDDRAAGKLRQICVLGTHSMYVLCMYYVLHSMYRSKVPCMYPVGIM